MDKGQSGVEFLIYSGLLLLIFSGVVLVVGGRQEMMYKERVSMDAKALSNLLASKVNNAVSVGDGYSHNFSTPRYLHNGENYSILINPKYQKVYVIWKNNYYSSPIVTSNITGNFSYGENRIENKGGGVRIE